ncbi:hypothetical protein THAOC_00117, partial [Thalassiosira oceanica]
SAWTVAWDSSVAFLRKKRSSVAVPTWTRSSPKLVWPSSTSSNPHSGLRLLENESGIARASAATIIEAAGANEELIYVSDNTATWTQSETWIKRTATRIAYEKEFRQVSDEIEIKYGREATLEEVIVFVTSEYSRDNALVIKHVDKIKKNQPDPTKGIEIYSGGHYRYLTNQSRFGSLSTLASTIHSSIAPALLDCEQSPAAVQSWVEGNSKHAHVVGPLSRYQTPSTLSTKLMPFIDNERRFTSLKTLATTVCGSILASVLDGDESQLAVEDWLGSNRNHAHVIGPLSRYETLSELCIKLMPFVDNHRSFISLSTHSSCLGVLLMAGGLDFKGALVGIRELLSLKHAEFYLQKCVSQGVQSMKDVESIPSLGDSNYKQIISKGFSRLSGTKMSLDTKRASKQQEMASKKTRNKDWTQEELTTTLQELKKLLGPNYEWISFEMEGNSFSTSSLIMCNLSLSVTRSITSELSEIGVANAQTKSGSNKKRCHNITYEHQRIYLGNFSDSEWEKFLSEISTDSKGFEIKIMHQLMR